MALAYAAALRFQPIFGLDKGVGMSKTIDAWEDEGGAPEFLEENLRAWKKLENELTAAGMTYSGHVTNGSLVAQLNVVRAFLIRYPDIDPHCIPVVAQPHDGSRRGPAQKS